MSLKTTAAPCALLLAALSTTGWASPALAQQASEPAVLDTVRHAVCLTVRHWRRHSGQRPR